MTATEDSSSRTSRARLYDGFATLGRPLGSGRRLEILDLLSQAPRTVGELAGEIEESTANTSQHLQVLRRAGLVQSCRQGTRIIYSLTAPAVGQLLSLLRDLVIEISAEGRQLANAHLGERKDIEWVSSKALRRMLTLGKTIVIDVRPRVDYEVGHIVGAVWVDLDRLRAFAESVPADVEVVAYCRSQYCSFADVAVRKLRAWGVQARRLEDGFPEWAREAHLAVESA